MCRISLFLKVHTCILALFCFVSGFGQSDSIIFKNANVIVGEIKGMDRNVLTIETDFSDSDFKIEWDGISEIYTNSFFLITISDGHLYNGKFKTVSSDSVQILTPSNQHITVATLDIVFLEDVDKGFWSRLYASIDVGYDLTKANNLNQLSGNTKVGYVADKWSLDASYNAFHSTQDDAEPINRQDGSLNYKYFLPKDWFLTTYITTSSNNEQKLDMRITSNLGLGFYMIHTNYTYWDISIGGTYNSEDYFDDSQNRKTWESFISTELNMFNTGDISFLLNVKFVPGLVNDRIRSDISFDLKYDLPLDFYIKLGTDYNYDSDPAEGASKSDYVLHTGFGWEW